MNDAETSDVEALKKEIQRLSNIIGHQRVLIKRLRALAFRSAGLAAAIQAAEQEAARSVGDCTGIVEENATPEQRLARLVELTLPLGGVTR